MVHLLAMRGPGPVAGGALTRAVALRPPPRLRVGPVLGLRSRRITLSESASFVEFRSFVNLNNEHYLTVDKRVFLNFNRRRTVLPLQARPAECGECAIFLNFLKSLLLIVLIILIVIVIPIQISML